MSSPRTARRRRRGAGGHGGHDGSDERWLLTYSDMITLLMALFMVLFSISSVNVSKYETLQRVLRDAFSGKIIPGGDAIRQSGETSKPDEASFEPLASIQALITRVEKKADEQRNAAGRRQEEEEFRRLKRQLDAYARRHGLVGQLETTIAQRGLVIRLLTDKVLFDSGRAVLKPRSFGVLAHIAQLLGLDRDHPIAVEGHTDSVPIRTAQFPSNWELSGARASSVVRFLVSRGVNRRRFEATGYADLHPIDSNRTGSGRHHNRRVEIVLLRLTKGQGGLTTP
jgi:chemotaxis protein MotB